MWLKRLVGVVMIITCIGMNALILVGFFVPDKTSNAALSRPSTSSATALPPTVTITASPDAITSGGFSGLTWSATGNPSSCIASDSWTGDKTASGAESTGRISTPGNYTYTLTCTNNSGSNKASAVVAVGASSTPASPAVPKNTTTVTQAAQYCGGSTPCYGPREVAQHGVSGNCWGWNGDRVYNITELDSSFHKAKSGISSIEIGSICGKDLAPSLNGSVSAEGQTRNHNPTTKSNSDRNEIPYFVGYFDNSKP